MKYFLTALLLNIFGVVSCQNLSQVDYEVLEAIIFSTDKKELEAIESSCSYSISKFDFYQDSINLQKEYFPGNIRRLCVAPIIEYYDEIPYQVIKNYLEIDTLKINQYLEGKYSIANWDRKKIKCDRIRFKTFPRNVFSKKFFNLIFTWRYLLISRPIYIGGNYSLVKKTYSEVGRRSRVKRHNEIIYLLQKNGKEWEVIKMFTKNIRTKG